MSLTVKAWHNLKAIAKLFLLGLCFFTFFRVALLFTNLGDVSVDSSDRWTFLFQSLSSGFLLDLAHSCLILIIPVILLSFLFIFNALKGWILTLAYFYVGGLFIFFFFNEAIAIPDVLGLSSWVFSHFSCLGSGAQIPLAGFNLYVFLFIFIVSSLFYILLLYKTLKKQKQFLLAPSDKFYARHYAVFVPVLLFIWGLLYLGARASCTV